jgi:alpha-1,2-mannosyltransferase
VASGVVLLARFRHQTSFQHIDFTIYRGAIVALRNGHGLYAYVQYVQPQVGAGFTYPPFAALVFEPIMRLPGDQALLVWSVLSLVLSAAFCRCCFLLLPSGAIPVNPWYVVAGLLWSVPISYTLRIGQVNALVALLVIVDVILALRGRRAGYLTGVAAAVKLTPLAVGAFFVAVRRVDAALAMVAGFIGCSVLAAVWNPAASREYWGRVIFDTRRVGTPDSAYNNSMWRLVDFSTQSAAGRLAAGAALVVVVVLAVLTGAAWAHGTGREALAGLVGGVAPNILSPITWSHHLYLLLLLPFAALAEPALRDHTLARYGLAALALVPLYDVHDIGQNSGYSVIRAVLMLAVVLAAGTVGLSAHIAAASRRHPLVWRLRHAVSARTGVPGPGPEPGSEDHTC